jgi:hypothetical protein
MDRHFAVMQKPRRGPGAQQVHLVTVSFDEDGHAASAESMRVS